VKKLETVEFHLKSSYLLPVSCHVRVIIVQLSHYFVGNELRVSPDKNPLYPEFSGDSQAIYQGLILWHIIDSMEI
jgi:hypothetical protein